MPRYRLQTSSDEAFTLQQIAFQLGREFAAVRDAAGEQPSCNERPVDAAELVWLIQSQELATDERISVDDVVLGRALFIEGFIAGSQSVRSAATKPVSPTLDPLVCPRCSSLSPGAERGFCGVLCEAGWIVLRSRTVSDSFADYSQRRRAAPAAEGTSDQ